MRHPKMFQKRQPGLSQSRLYLPSSDLPHQPLSCSSTVPSERRASPAEINPTLTKRPSGCTMRPVGVLGRFSISVGTLELFHQGEANQSQQPIANGQSLAGVRSIRINPFPGVGYRFHSTGEAPSGSTGHSLKQLIYTFNYGGLRGWLCLRTSISLRA